MPISNALERNRNNSKTLTISWTKTISKEIKVIIKFIVGILVCNYLDLRISFVSCSYIGKGDLFSLWKHRHLYQIKLYDRRNRESLALIMSHFLLSNWTSILCNRVLLFINYLKIIARDFYRVIFNKGEARFNHDAKKYRANGVIVFIVSINIQVVQNLNSYFYFNPFYGSHNFRLLVLFAICHRDSEWRGQSDRCINSEHQ